jgi:hypothetical protein
MELLANLLVWLTVACLVVAYPFARRWAKRKQAMKQRSGEYALPNPGVERLAGISLSLGGLGMLGFVVYCFSLSEPLAVASYVLIALGFVGTGIAQVRIDLNKKNLLPLRPTVGSDSKVLAETLVVSVPQLLNKFRLEWWGGISVGLFSFGCFVALGLYFLKFGFAHFDSSLSPIWRYGTMVMGFSLFGLLFVSGTRLAVTAKRELTLCERGGSPFFKMSNWGIEVSLALLEGEFRARLRESNEVVLRIPWSSVSSWSVERQRKSGRGSETPPYYKISLKHEPTAVFILRRPLVGKELEILDFARRRLPMPMEMKDSAYS